MMPCFMAIIPRGHNNCLVDIYRLLVGTQFMFQTSIMLIFYHVLAIGYFRAS